MWKFYQKLCSKHPLEGPRVTPLAHVNPSIPPSIEAVHICPPPPSWEARTRHRSPTLARTLPLVLPS
jgi:hypothetical protein